MTVVTTPATTTPPVTPRPTTTGRPVTPPCARVTATTREIPDPGELTALLQGRDVAEPTRSGAAATDGHVVSWVREGDGMVGWGALATARLRGPDLAGQGVRWWREQLAGIDVDDPVGLPGCGPLLFGSLPFDGRTGEATFVIPHTVVGRRDGRAWLTTYGGHDTVPTRRSRPSEHPRQLRYADGALSASAWISAVAEGVRRIRAGEAEKLVLARDLVATGDTAIRTPALLTELSRSYVSCWTFCVDGLLGATPEMLIARSGRQIVSRVLAGTIARQLDAQGASLLDSRKDQHEHTFAAHSVAECLAPYCAELDVPDGPSLLRLPNLTHLATDITGTLTRDVCALELAGAVHPPGAVCGHPTGIALDLIPELERMNRGRYAGPVGWLDRAGDGEWGIALRCAQLDAGELRMFAGCGIVADSDPDAELAETQTKFLVIRDALEASARATD